MRMREIVPEYIITGIESRKSSVPSREMEKIFYDEVRDFDAEPYFNAYKKWHGEGAPPEYSRIPEYLVEKEITVAGLQKLINVFEKDLPFGIFSCYIGIFISYLGNELCDDNVMDLHTSDRIFNLAYCNSHKTWIINGPSGACLGEYMSGGKIIVNGNAYNSLGEAMRGGKIIVNGDVDNNAGIRMSGGSMLIRGDAGCQAGCDMNGGMIEIRGNAAGSMGAKMQGGKIKVMGSVGNNCGMYMQGDEILVMGNAGKHAGRGMEGGLIRIVGDSGRYSGHAMSGGELVIEGNADDDVGGEMKGGKIWIGGEMGKICKRINGGEIYHRDAMVYPAGMERIARDAAAAKDSLLKRLWHSK